MVAILIMSAKYATLGLIVNVFWNKGYEVISFFLRDSSYVVDVIKSLNFGNSSISMREFMITSIL